MFFEIHMFRSFTMKGGKLENCGFFTGLLIAHRGPTLGLNCDIKKPQILMKRYFCVQYQGLKEFL